jgi:hypothetical protein
MDDDKNLRKKTTDVVTNAAQKVTKTLKSAGEAVAEAMTPKPVRAGDTLIIPSADPSIPPVVVPVKRARRSRARKAIAPAGRRTSAAKARAASSRKQPAKSRAPRTSAARKPKGVAKANRKTARRPGRKTAGRRPGKAARR